MRNYILILLVGVLITSSAALFVERPHFLSDAFIDLVNENAKTWKAGRNFQENASVRYILRLMGVRTQYCEYQLHMKPLHKKKHIPKEFDARKHWRHCPSVHDILDQGACGSSWALSAVAAMSDRMCIHYKGKVKFRISAQDLLACCISCGNKCDGGSPPDAWRYWRATGLVTGGPYGSHQGCLPYELEPCEHHVNGSRPQCGDKLIVPQCHRQCEAGYPKPYNKDFHKAEDVYQVNTSADEIQLEIKESGPVQAQFSIYEDFLHYKSGVYQHTIGSKLGDHAVKILGWGEENGVPYWLCANSWNDDWGDKGFIKIRRGVNECDIEACVYSGIPL